MISTSNISLAFGGRRLFDDVNVKFTPGNCFGVIGANGAGKSTFLKILSGEITPQSGSVNISSGQRLSFLKQNHYAFDEHTVLKTVLMGNEALCRITEEKEALYAKEDFTEADGMRASELEAEFAELDGWEAESEAGILLSGLGIPEDLHNVLMKDLEAPKKVKVLLAQALIGSPDILLLDEPTNHLDLAAIHWLEEFLLNFKNIVIVVSHDRHFLNKVCTNIVDIDYGKATSYSGNYDFFIQSSELALTLRSNQNKKAEEKAKELKSFIQRFSANASKSKQATSRQKQLDKINIEDLPVSSRKYPYVHFTQKREAGKEILFVENISKTVNGIKVLDDVSFVVAKGDKTLFLSDSDLSVTTLFQILNDELKPDSGSFRWGVTTSQAYLPTDNTKYFDSNPVSIVDWLRAYSEDKDESFIRGFLGRMLFSGEEALKKTDVLSGGEKVRCMLAKMMLSESNVLILDGPTNHLDLESIDSVNKGLIKFDGTVLLASHDQQLNSTVANRIIDLKTGKIQDDRKCTFSEYLERLG